MTGSSCQRTPNLLLRIATLAVVPLLAAANVDCDPCAIGLVFDGPASFNVEMRAIFEEEIKAVSAPRFTAVFPDSGRKVADWSLDGVRDAVESVLADPDIDILLTAGPIASSHAVTRGSLSKPVVAMFVLDPEAQRFPLSTNTDGERVSGIPNLSYVTFTRDPAEELSTLREVVPFRRLAYLVSQSLLDAVPALEENLGSAARLDDVQPAIIGVGTSVDAALAAIPPQADAVYVTPLLHLQPADFDGLVQGLIDRSLPAFSYWGRREVDRGLLASLYLDTDMLRLGRRVALHVRRVLDGEDAGDLPVDFHRSERLTLNMETARSIGLHPAWAVTTAAELLHNELPGGGRRLDLTSAVREAVTANLDLAALDRSIAAGKQSVRVARAPLAPQITASGSFDTIDRDNPQLVLGLRPTWRPVASLGISQQLYSDGAKARVAVEGHAQTSREEARAELALDIAHAAAVGYLNVRRARIFERIQRQNLDLTRTNLESAQSRRRIGVARASEVIRWENQIASNRRAVINAAATLEIARIALNRLRHRPLEEHFATADVDLADPALLASSSTLDTYAGNALGFAVFRDFMASEALAESPELRQLDASIAATERTVVAARRSFWSPIVAASGNVIAAQPGQGPAAFESLAAPFSFDRPNALNWTLGVSATLPLSTGGARRAEQSRAQEQLDQLRLARAAAAERIEQRLRSALHQAGASYAGIELVEDAAAAARSNLDLVRDAYEQGALPILDLIDAQNASLVAEQRAATAVYDFLIDLMEVHRATGRFGFFMDPEDLSAFGERLRDFYTKAGYAPSTGP